MISEDAARKSRIVLGVDDQAENIMLLEALLETAGYSFMSASSGPECLSLALRCTPRLILLDVQMPEMDGYETCRRLRAIWLLRQVPIAFLTARKAADDVKVGLAAGGNDFIVKPFDHEKLLARVDYWTKRTVAAA